MTRTAPRICPLCEATCGLTLTIGRDRTTGGEIVTAARGDADDVFSAGYLCPKGASFAQLDNDPDRLEIKKFCPNCGKHQAHKESR